VPPTPRGWLLGPWGDFVPAQGGFYVPPDAFCPPPQGWLLSPSAHPTSPRLFQNNTAKLVKQLSKSSDDEGEHPLKTPQNTP